MNIFRPNFLPALTIHRLALMTSVVASLECAACSACDDKKSPPSSTTASDGAATAIAPIPTAASDGGDSTAIATDVVEAGIKAVASDGGGSLTRASDAGPESKGPNPEIPKPCVDGMGRLGHLTFVDLGAGKVRVQSDKNASATCRRVEPTKYQCDWIVDGKPSGSFVDVFDPASRNVGGSIAKGKMFTCPPSSQH